MNRTLIAVATALLAATGLFASAAEACISCEYVPPVAHSPSPAKPFQAKRYEKKRVMIAGETRAARSAKKRIAKAPAVAAEPPAAKEPEVAKAAPAEQPPAAAPAETENQRISTASLLDAGPAPAEEEPKAESGAEVGCKKFFPTVGKTMTVPCE